MIKDYSTIKNCYIACGRTDMRKGINGLVGIVERSFKLDPYEDSIFLFCGRNKTKIKGLHWDRNGFVMLQKTLQDGRFQWPKNGDEARLLTPQQLRWLMEGLSIEQKRAHKEVSGVCFH